jgi:hypothetical protein
MITNIFIIKKLNLLKIRIFFFLDLFLNFEKNIFLGKVLTQTIF